MKVNIVFLVLSLRTLSTKVTDSTVDGTRFLYSTALKERLTSSGTCFMERQLLTSNNIDVNPSNTEYHHNETITVTCKPGHYLQRPLREIYFNNKCHNGHWTHSLTTVPICSTACRQWNATSNSWQAVRITDSEGTSGVLISPNYPANIIEEGYNCSFTFDTNQYSIKLSSASIQLINYVLIIDSNQGRFVWPISNSSIGDHELSGLRNVTVTVQRNAGPRNNIGKVENFKLLYRMSRFICTMFELPELLVSNTTRIGANRVTQQYSCVYPYSLIGPSEKMCISGSWHPLAIPRCEFLCIVDTRIVVNGNINIKVNMITMLKCRIQLIAANSKNVIKVKLKNPSSNKNSFCINIKSYRISLDCAILRPAYYFLPSPVTITYDDTRSLSVVGDIVEIVAEMGPIILCPVISSRFGNGVFKYTDRDIYSSGQVQCNQDYYWIGPSQIFCVLDEDGNAHWNFGAVIDCVKICKDDFESLTISKDPIAMSLPPFLLGNFTGGQICKWKIASLYFNPIIEITCMQDLRKFSNITVHSDNRKDKLRVTPKRTLFANQKSFKVIYTCIERICMLTVDPLRTLVNIPTNMFGRITVKLHDKEGQYEHSAVIWIVLLVVIVFTVPLFVILLLDYWRHPYTGFTAKVLHRFKGSQLKKIASLFIFEVKPCKDISKTQADIIVFYNRYHADSRAICIRRSFNSLDPTEGSLAAWKYRFSSVRRRFSDITDMVLYACTVRVPSKRLSHSSSNEKVAEE